jgi:hypothetical protein
LQPAQQIIVAGRRGLEALHPQQPAELVERRRHVHIQMGVDAAGDGAAVSSYDGRHRHPFCGFSSRGGTPPPVACGVGVIALLAQGDPPHPTIVVECHDDSGFWPTDRSQDS